ncbi:MULTISPECIES: hypothetical protein [Serratia]|uniref:hypothetical protein n=1 Tax=Serratia TaxID=613 RepID=UPI0018D69EF8|nr:hypothetical protein [Serratia marcescens]MBH2769610.1 hypothetical protein [Serratia marcescens]BEN51567.1 hypothetical protein SMKC057_36790 [Serratia marcescens]CAI1727627.1 Uncharacterised protein [Serratia marcescens]HCD7748641.1 hypothetical protein [Serratia marcescens]
MSTTITFLTTLLGAVVGGGIAGYFSSKATKESHQHQKKISEDNEKLIISSLLQAIHDELETIFDRYHETIGNRIESLPEGGALIFYYPVVNDYFTVYNGNSFLIGRVKNNDLRKSIIKTYTLGKGMMDSLRMNNEILQKVEHWESIHAETQLPIHQEKAKHYYMSLVEYAKSIKKQHLDLKDNLKSTLRALVKNGVLNESDQKK